MDNEKDILKVTEPADIKAMKKKMTKCKACGGSVAKSAKRCPHCGHKRKYPFLAFVLIVVGVIMIISSLGGEPKEQENYVTLENFEKITTDMTYEDVCDLFQKEGTILSEVDIGEDEYKTQIYYWYDDTGVANCNITFQGGYMVSKAQVGLK